MGAHPAQVFCIVLHYGCLTGVEAQCGHFAANLRRMQDLALQTHGPGVLQPGAAHPCLETEGCSSSLSIYHPAALGGFKVGDKWGDPQGDYSSLRGRVQPAERSGGSEGISWRPATHNIGSLGPMAYHFT